MARRFLFVNVPIYCRSIVEMPTAEGDALLKKLYQHVQRPEFHVRVVWQENTVVIWENVHCLRTIPSRTISRTNGNCGAL